MKLDKQIYNRGKITIASRLSQEFYNYNIDTETLAFDRISEALYDLGQNYDMSPSGCIITLETTVPVGAEVIANRIWQWLVIHVTATDRYYEDDKEFISLLEKITDKAFERLVTNSKSRAAIEVGDNYTIITDG